MNIEMKGIDKAFGSNQVLKNAGFFLKDGEVHALMGENGAGKSTLMKILTGVYTRDAGTVLVDGKEMTELSEKELRLARRNITMIFQSFNLLMQRTCLKNICFPMELSGIPAAQAK